MLLQLQVFVNVSNNKLLCRLCQHPRETSDLHIRTMADNSLSLPHRSCFCIFRPALGSTRPPVKRVPGLVPGGKVVGAWSWLPTPSGAEVKERLELYLYSPSGPLCADLGERYCFTAFFYKHPSIAYFRV